MVQIVIDSRFTKVLIYILIHKVTIEFRKKSRLFIAQFANN